MRCHNLVKWLSHYFILFLFYFLIWTYYTRKKCGKISHNNVICHSHVLGCHKVISYDKCRKVVYRPYNSCINSI